MTHSVSIENTRLNYKKVKRTIERKKSRKYPKEPSIYDIKMEFSKPEIMLKYGYTLDGNSKFYIDTIVEQDFKFTIFASHYVKNFIEEKIAVGTRNFLMDGTFGNLPEGYYQLLTITIEYMNDVS